MTTISLIDIAKLKQYGYAVERWDRKGWLLLDPEGDPLMVGSHGCVSPTQWEAVAEGIKRIEED